MTDRHRYYRNPETGAVGRTGGPWGSYTEPVVVIPAEVVTDEALASIDPTQPGIALYEALRDASPEPESPPEPMGENAWVRDYHGHTWLPLRDGKWARMDGDSWGVIREWQYLVEDFGPVTIHDDEGDDE